MGGRLWEWEEGWDVLIRKQGGILHDDADEARITVNNCQRNVQVESI